MTDMATEATSKEGYLAALDDIAAGINSTFTDVRDEARLAQFNAALATARMAAEHLHDAAENRKGLKAVHDAEAEHGGWYAQARAQNPSIYAELEHSHYETIGG